jgi:hypothetical protein
VIVRCRICPRYLSASGIFLGLDSPEKRTRSRPFRVRTSKSSSLAFLWENDFRSLLSSFSRRPLFRVSQVSMLTYLCRFSLLFLGLIGSLFIFDESWFIELGKSGVIPHSWKLPMSFTRCLFPLLFPHEIFRFAAPYPYCARDSKSLMFPLLLFRLQPLPCGTSTVNAREMGASSSCPCEKSPNHFQSLTLVRSGVYGFFHLESLCAVDEASNRWDIGNLGLN